MVCRVGLGGKVELPQKTPLLSPGFSVFDELLLGKVIGAKPFPDATRATKVGDTGLSADSGAGKDNRSLRIYNQLGNLISK